MKLILSILLLLVAGLLVGAVLCRCDEAGFHPLRRAWNRFRLLPRVRQLLLIVLVVGVALCGGGKGTGPRRQSAELSRAPCHTVGSTRTATGCWTGGNGRRDCPTWRSRTGRSTTATVTG